MDGYTKEEVARIAGTIIKQLGGTAKLKHGCGVKNIYSFITDKGQVGVTMKLAKNISKFNHLRIVLNSMDTYDIEFLRFHNCKKTRSETFEGYYGDMLQPLFERITGMIVNIFG